MGAWINPLAFELFDQGRSIQVEQLRGSGSDPIGFAQRFHDELLFVLLHLSRKIDPVVVEPNELLLKFRRRRSTTDFGGQVLDHQCPLLLQDDQALDHIFQLANVAGPIILDQELQGLR